MRETIALVIGIGLGVVAIGLTVNGYINKTVLTILLIFAIGGGLAIANYDRLIYFKGGGIDMKMAHKEIDTAKDAAIAEIREEVLKQKEVIALWVKVLDGLIRREPKLVLEDIEGLARREPEDYYVFQTWGNVLFGYAEKEGGDKEKELIKKAEEIYIKAESLKKGSCAYNLACIRAFDGDEKECKRWLEIGKEAGELPTLERAMRDKYLKNVRDKGWFKEVGWGEH